MVLARVRLRAADGVVDRCASQYDSARALDDLRRIFHGVPLHAWSDECHHDGGGLAKGWSPEVSLRVYLTGRMALETQDGIVDETAFPGRQGRIAFAYLALSAQRPVARDVLADALWPDTLPSSWDTALKSVVSKLRAVLVDARIGPEPTRQCRGLLPVAPPGRCVGRSGSVRDVRRLRRGRAAARRLRPRLQRRYRRHGHRGRRSFLAGEDAPWIETVRADLRTWHVRALDVLAHAWIERGNATLAVTLATDAVAIEPFREPGYRMLMRGADARRQSRRSPPHVRPVRSALCRRVGSRA